jgi:DNA (cytosine-5)-methyltransferase 1
MNFYNENDPSAAAWIRELIEQKLIPEGQVDERSITEVQPEDVRGFVQAHWFCGIAGWSYALQLAGWPTDRPVWTASLPCPSFSVAGKGKGFDDPRGQLWKPFFDLVRECKPQRIFGEQVANAIGHGWLDRIFSDLESEGYACGAVVLGAHSVGAPHIRQRLFWVAFNRVAHSQDSIGRSKHQEHEETHGRNRPGWSRQTCGKEPFDIIHCLDGNSRRIESGSSPLAPRLPRGLVPSGDPSFEEAQASAEARKMRLTGYGNSICPQVAAEFIMAFLETTPRIPPGPHAPTP